MNDVSSIRYINEVLTWMKEGCCYTPSWFLQQKRSRHTHLLAPPLFNCYQEQPTGVQYFQFGHSSPHPQFLTDNLWHFFFQRIKFYFAYLLDCLSPCDCWPTRSQNICSSSLQHCLASKQQSIPSSSVDLLIKPQINHQINSIYRMNM